MMIQWIVKECGPTWDAVADCLTLEQFRSLKSGKYLEVESGSANELIERGFAAAIDVKESGADGNDNLHQG